MFMPAKGFGNCVKLARGVGARYTSTLAPLPGLLKAAKTGPLLFVPVTSEPS